MGRYEFGLATRADDAELRAVLAATPMPGRISVSFRREPSFFDAAVVEGGFHQVIVCRDREEGRIIGFGCRSVRERYLNGEPTFSGYLSSLRLLPGHRNLGLVARGYACFRKLHEDGRAPVYLTTIAEGNERASATLTTGRAGLPRYTFAGRYHTVVLPIPQRRLPTRQPGWDVREATVRDRDCILAFLGRVGRERQFFPCLKPADLFEQGGTLSHLAPPDVLLAIRDGRIVGTLGGWDQQGFRQSVVEGYTGPLHWLWPVYNAWATVCGRPWLPPVGEPFRYLMAAVPTVEANDGAVFDALLRALLSRAAGGPHDYLLVGMHETDPLLPVARRHGADSYVTRMYLVGWDDGDKLLPRLDGRPAYLELGCL